MKHVQTGMCIIDTKIIQGTNESWGNVSFVELSNSCLDSAAQFRFRDNGAMLNLQRPGCLFPVARSGSGYDLDMFYIYVSSGGLDPEACADRPDRDRYTSITQTCWGGLSIKYKGFKKITVQTWCAVNKTYQRLADKQGVDLYIGLTTDCYDTENKHFNFGKFFSSLRAYYCKNLRHKIHNIKI